MKLENVDRAFVRIGACVKFSETQVRVGGWSRPFPLVIRDGRQFIYLLDLKKALAGAYDVLDVQPAERALILVDPGETGRHLCWHDGKRWQRRDLGDRVSRVEAALRPPVAPQKPSPTPGWAFVPMPNFQPSTEVRHRAETPVDRCGKRGFVAEYESQGTDGATYVRGWVWRPDEPLLALRLWHRAARA